MTKVTGIDGVFFKSSSPGQLYEWYGKHLGLERSPGARVILHWRDSSVQEKSGMTVLVALSQRHRVP
jgi:hypothetical protein